MHIYHTMKGDKAINFCQKTLQLDPAEFDLTSINRVEVHATDLDDPGEDYCEYRVIDTSGNTLAVRREMGY